MLTYSIATDTISFPARTVGLDAITRTLVVDFATRFESCKTYYVCEAPRGRSTFARIPWLVVMREPAAGSLRIGKGYYEWSFAHLTGQGARVDGDAYPYRPDGCHTGCRCHGCSASAQTGLTYPWLSPSMLRYAYDVALGQRALAFLHDFEIPWIFRARLNRRLHRCGARVQRAALFVCSHRQPSCINALIERESSGAAMLGAVHAEVPGRKILILCDDLTRRLPDVEPFSLLRFSELARAERRCGIADVLSHRNNRGLGVGAS